MPRRMPRPLMRWRTDPCDIFGDSNVFGLVVSMFPSWAGRPTNQQCRYALYLIRACHVVNDRATVACL